MGETRSRQFSWLGDHWQVPYYALVSPSSQTQSSAVTGSTSRVLNHPVLQYHHANDSLVSLRPRLPDERVHVVDYDPLTLQCTRAQCISGSSAVTGIKVTEAPGAGSPADPFAGWCNSMFVLETTTLTRGLSVTSNWGMTLGLKLCPSKGSNR